MGLPEIAKWKHIQLVYLLITQFSPDALAAPKSSKLILVLKCALDYSKSTVFCNKQLKGITAVNCSYLAELWNTVEAFSINKSVIYSVTLIIFLVNLNKKSFHVY